MKLALHEGVRVLLLGLAVLAMTARAQGDPAPPEAEKAAAPGDVIASVMKEHQKAREAFFAKYRAAGTDEEREKIYESDWPKDSEYATRIMAEVRKAPAEESILDGLLWAMPRGDKKMKAECIKILGEHHMKSERMAAACLTMSRARSLAAERMLRNLISESPHHEVRGQASFALAKALSQQAKLMSGPEGLTDQAREWLGKEVVAKMESVGVEKLNGEAVKLLETVAANYGDVDRGRGRSLADAAKADLFEMRNLSIGKVAPDIEGKDLDGVAFKLSDYRGKVVMLDFWGDW